jgi:hypothetical protein
MGLSVGWGDRYGANIVDQYIDVSNVGNGRYRLRATADAVGEFVEANETNNLTWVDLQLQANKVRVLAYGPVA